MHARLSELRWPDLTTIEFAQTGIDGPARANNAKKDAALFLFVIAMLY